MGCGCNFFQLFLCCRIPPALGYCFKDASPAARTQRRQLEQGIIWRAKENTDWEQIQSDLYKMEAQWTKDYFLWIVCVIRLLQTFLFDIKCLMLGLYGEEKLLFSLLRPCPDPWQSRILNSSFTTSFDTWSVW